MQYNFSESLSFSHDQAALPIWEKIYRLAFPAFESMACVHNDGWAQRGGIDRVITLSSGKTVTVDEKVRKKDYGDILLEYWSDKDRKVRGWVAKDLACDYIAYAILPKNECYLLPFLQLRLAWKNNHRQWLSKYKITHADNGHYTTVGVAVPVNDVLCAINNAMTIYFQRGLHEVV